MSLIDPSSPFGEDGCPRARNGCTCPCHRVREIMHVMDCCEQVPLLGHLSKADDQPSSDFDPIFDQLGEILKDKGVPMSVSDDSQEIKAKLELILEFSDQIAAVKSMVERIKELSPDEIKFLHELIEAGTQQPSLPEQEPTTIFRLGDKVTYADSFKGLTYPFSFGTRYYKEAIVACLKPFVLVANPDADNTVACWHQVNPKELKVIGKAADGELRRTRKALTEDELVATGEVTRLEV